VTRTLGDPHQIRRIDLERENSSGGFDVLIGLALIATLTMVVRDHE
jgi:hypothetical protein